MNERPCKKCGKLKEKHIPSSYPYEFGAWCYDANDTKDTPEYNFRYEPETNLAYLERIYNEQKTL